MAGFVRTKRVTDPLDARVRDRLVGRDSSDLGYASSGSEHSADGGDSPCLSELVHGFLEEDEQSETRSTEYDSDQDRDDSVSDRVDTTESILRSCHASGNNGDSYKRRLLAHVAEATEVCSRLRSNKSAFRRSVMAYLRELGHNAAICKTRWDSSGGLTAGNYEFIDAVVQPTSAAEQSRRYFVDLDFAAEFELARPSAHYSRLLESLPRLFVGNGDDLKRTVRAMCDAAKRSLKSTDLSVPPWRKNRYMQNKWFGPYRRTANLVPEKPVLAAIPSISTVKCRWVGFDAVVADGNVNGPPFVRTR